MAKNMEFVCPHCGQIIKIVRGKVVFDDFASFDYAEKHQEKIKEKLKEKNIELGESAL